MITSVVIRVANKIAYPGNFVLRDTGTGCSVFARWDSMDVENIKYRMIVKNTVDNTTETYETTNNEFIIPDLVEGTLYEITLYSVINGESGFGITRSIVPLSLPRIVSDIRVQPLYRKIDFVWNANQELDLFGYRIFRRAEHEAEFDEIVTLNSTFTTWSDTTTEDKIWYYYQIFAVDNDGNLSPDADVFRSRHLSFNSGIVVIDFTRNTNNNLMLPPKNLVDTFYRNLLTGYEFSEIEFENDEEIRIEDVGVYSTFIIHKNSFNSAQNTALTRILRTIIDYGGNILFTANDPLDFANQVHEGYPTYFTEGDFSFDYFNIKSVNRHQPARFAKGISTGWHNIPDLQVEPTKISVVLNGRLHSMEVFAGTEFQVLYTYSSDSDNPNFVVSDGLPVAIYTTKGKSHIVVTSIPLYFIKEEQAKEFMQIVLNVFDTETTDYDERIMPVPNDFALRNFPNPFNPTTSIQFTVGAMSSSPVNSGHGDMSPTTHVKLNVYNVRGQLVKTLVDGFKEAGTHTVEWNGDDLQGNSVSSGVYFYRMRAGEQSVIRKMLLLK